MRLYHLQLGYRLPLGHLRRNASTLRWVYGSGAVAVVALSLATVPFLLLTLATALSPALDGGGGVAAVGLRAAAVPWWDVPAVWLALAVSLAWHELGHAAAATAEGVRVASAGVGLFLGALPTAFVELDRGALAALPPSRALRVHAAGCWHNALLCAAVAAAVWWLPFGLSVAGYSTGAGGVTALGGLSGVARGDLLVAVCGGDRFPQPAGAGSQSAATRPCALNPDCATPCVRDWLACLGQQEAPAVLVVGDPGGKKSYVNTGRSGAEIAAAMEVTDYRGHRLPLGLPAAVERGLRYTFGVSGAMGLLNAAPVVGLDGEQLAKAALVVAVGWVGGGALPGPRAGSPQERGGRVLWGLLWAVTALLVATIVATWGRALAP